MYKKVLLATLIYSSTVISSPTEVMQRYFYDIVFLNGLPLSEEAWSYCQENSEYLSESRLEMCQIFNKLSGKKLSIRVYEDSIQITEKENISAFSSYFDEDYSLHKIKSYTREGEIFSAVIDTASYVSFADVYPNLLQDKIFFKGPYGKENMVGLALVDMNTDIGGVGNKTIFTRGGKTGVLGVDFIGQYGQFSFYSDGIWIQPENITCTHKCVSYDADFDGENLHFYYPFNDETKRRVSFETGSSISTVPFAVEENCVSEKVDFSELEERGLDVGDDARLCKNEFKFGDYSMHSSVVTHTSREIDGEPLPVMGMNMINAFDHVTVDLPAGKIYFYFP